MQLCPHLAPHMQGLSAVCRCTMVDLGELSQLDSSACVRQHPGSARAHTHLAQPITPAAPGRHLLPQGLPQLDLHSFLRKYC